MADPIKKPKPEENMNAARNNPPKPAAPKPEQGGNPGPAPVKQPRPVASAPMNPPIPPTGNNNNPPAPPKGPETPKGPKKDPVSEKIMKQGFAPKGWKPEDGTDIPETHEPKKHEFSMDISNDYYDIMDFDDQYSGKFLDTFEPEVLLNEAHNVGEKLRKKGHDISDDEVKNYYMRDHLLDSVFYSQDISEVNDKLRKLGLEPVSGEGLSFNSEPQSEPKVEHEEEIEEYSPDDEPGSVVVTPKLKDFAREYLSRDGELKPEAIDRLIDAMSKDHNAADFYRRRMKEEYDNRQRERASKLFGTDLSKESSPNHFESELESAPNIPIPEMISEDQVNEMIPKLEEALRKQDEQIATGGNIDSDVRKVMLSQLKMYRKVKKMFEGK